MKNNTCSSERMNGFLSILELERGTNTIVILIYKHVFEERLKLLKSRNNLYSKIKLFLLHPFLDENSSLRVGSRLKNAKLSEYKKYLFILPKKIMLQN